MWYLNVSNRVLGIGMSELNSQLTEVTILLCLAFSSRSLGLIK